MREGDEIGLIVTLCPPHSPARPRHSTSPEASSVSTATTSSGSSSSGHESATPGGVRSDVDARPQRVQGGRQLFVVSIFASRHENVTTLAQHTENSQAIRSRGK